MARLPLSTFVPLKSSDAVMRLIGYLSVLKPRERYNPQDCIAAITTNILKAQFCQAVIDKGIYSRSDYAISSVINQMQLRKKAQELDKLKAENKKHKKEERRQRNREAQLLEVELKRNEEETKKTSIREKQQQAHQSLPTSDCVSIPMTTSDNHIIARDVKASSFSVNKGCIRYQNYILESVRIPAIPTKILNNIEQTFTIKKDYGFFGKRKNNLRFIFEPATDLSKFLIEATNASLKLGNTTIYIDKAVEEHGMFFHRENRYNPL